MTLSEQFASVGYVKMKLIDDELLSYLKTGVDAHRELRYRLESRRWFSQYEEDLFAFGDGQIPRSFSSYGMPVCETLLLSLRHKFEEVVNKRLDPAYSYTRIYYNKADMKAHKDRPSCEFSSTINIHGGESWPIYITGYNGETSEVLLEPGYGIIYNGTDCEHWRLENPGDEVYQTFLHYIDADGPYRDYIYDKRKFLYLQPTG